MDGRVDAENVSHFVAAYQSVTPLTLGELWAGPINHHWTKNLVASRDGSRLYVWNRKPRSGSHSGHKLPLDLACPQSILSRMLDCTIRMGARQSRRKSAIPR